MPELYPPRDDEGEDAVDFSPGVRIVPDINCPPDEVWLVSGRARLRRRVAVNPATLRRALALGDPWMLDGGAVAP